MKKLSEKFTRLRPAFRFFLQHAGYATPPGKAVCALSLARAEQWANERGLEYVVEPDQDADASFVETWDEREQANWNEQEHECICISAVLPCHEHGTDCKHSRVMASLGGIFDADSAYLRVVKAELASEAQNSL
jgi:hypothetical protein